MPAFSPKLGSSTLTPNESFFKRWIKRFKTGLLACLLLVVVFSLSFIGWWIWQGQYVPAAGGTAIEGLVGQPNHLNPLFASDNLVDSELTPLLFRGLLKYDDKQELTSDLASNWQRSEDGKTYTITLGKTAWHDGQPVTTADVAFTIKLCQSADYHGSWSKSFTDVTVTVKDATHMQIVLKEPFAPFAQTLTMGILPKHLLDGKSIDQLQTDPFNLHPVGNGVLKFDSLQLNPQTHLYSELQLRPVDGYLDDVVFRFFDSTDSMINDFKLGKIQMLGGSYDPAFEQLSSFPDKQQKNSLLRSQSYGLFFNLHNQHMSDIGLRQALAFAIPKNQMIADVFHNQVVALNGVYQPDYWAFSSRAETYTYNQQSAQTIWDKVEGKPQTIRLLIPDKPIYQDLAKAISQSWQKLGLKVAVITKSPEQMGAVVNAHEVYDVVLLGEQSDVDPDRYTTWHSTQMPPNGLNITGESNKRVDKGLEDGRKGLTKEDRIADYDIFQYYLAKDAPVIWLYQPKYVYIWSNKIKGVKVENSIQEPQDRFATVSKWYVKTKRRD